VHSNSHHADHTTLQAIEKAEGGARLALHIKRYSFQSTHVEESFILNIAQTWMVQKVGVHKASGFMLDFDFLY
jgi:hypothetical protein